MENPLTQGRHAHLYFLTSIFFLIKYSNHFNRSFIHRNRHHCSVQ